MIFNTRPPIELFLTGDAETVNTCRIFLVYSVYWIPLLRWVWLLVRANDRISFFEVASHEFGILIITQKWKLKQGYEEGKI